MQRLRAKHIRKHCTQHWPIYEASGKTPEGWPGWPEGKEFAMILSHDVKGPKGLSRCRQLAELEMEHGFRSSFNFAPTRESEVPKNLLAWLRANGFEIGVHDQAPRNNTFGFQQISVDRARVINRWLRSWEAIGFRATGMSRNLDWLHGLQIEYDASTSDFDPFADQPQNAQTAFPFWMPKPDPQADAIRNTETNGHGPSDHLGSTNGKKNGFCPSGYVELPATLSTDQNLFVLLQETGIDIWRQKLRWLVEKGAMVSLVTHPNCMAMPDQHPSAGEYPIELYRNFLDHVKAEYAGRFWSALPREVAAYCRTFGPAQARPPRRVAMVSFSYYKFDNRVRRYAEALARRGDHVRVFCIGTEEEVQAGRWEALKGVEFLPLQSRANRESSKWIYGWRLVSFFWRVTDPAWAPGFARWL